MGMYSLLLFSHCAVLRVGDADRTASGIAAIRDMSSVEKGCGLMMMQNMVLPQLTTKSRGGFV